MENNKLKEDNRSKITFIVNPFSKLGEGKHLERLIAKELAADKYSCRVVCTQHAGDATHLSQVAISQGAAIVVAVGGDGTVNEVARSLIGTKTVLGIIPAGSGNALARHLKIPLQAQKAMAVINLGKVSKMDTVTINDFVFVAMAGLGFDAFVTHCFAKKRKHGFFLYLKTIIQEFVRYQPQEYLVEVDGKQLRQQAFLLSFANANQFGYNTMIAPQAHLQDGLLEVCMVPKPSWWRLFWVLFSLFTKNFQNSPHAQIIQAKAVRVIRGVPGIGHVDGEPIMLDKVVDVKINPLSLHVISPDSARL